jgi:two-component system, OmpR family, sensor histidine kinase KdpD
MLGRRRLFAPPRRVVRGWVVTLAGIAVATSLLLPFRHRITPDTAALVLVVPVVVGVVIGGVSAVPVGVVFGFVAFDFFFIPPYGTFSVAAAQHWVSLAVYSAVGLTVGGVVAQLRRARLESQARQAETQVLYELSQSLATESSLEAKLERILVRLRETLGASGAAVLVESDGALRVVARAGESLSEPALRALLSGAGPEEPVLLAGPPSAMVAALRSTLGRVGWLLAVGSALDDDNQRLLATFANQAAVAIEQARLGEEANRTRMLEEVDRLRSALMGSVSHDLRTPLASIKASISDLADPAVALGDEDRATLLETIQAETDRLTRLVSNLLDMSRIEAGALELHRAATPLDELVGDVIERMSGEVANHRLRIEVPSELPFVDVDYQLIDQVLANLVENATRYSPPGTQISIGAQVVVPGWVEVRVADHGPGVPDAERRRIFDRFYQLRGERPHQAGTGMGLSICHGVVAAHGGRIWVETTPGGGATFVFRLPVAATGGLVEEPDTSPAEA